MGPEAGRRRVQTAFLIYLLLLVGSNAGAWTWFVLHRHAPGHQFPLGAREQRFSDLLLFSGKHQIWKDPRLANFSNLNGTLYPRNYLPLAVMIYLFLLQVCAPYAVPVLLGTVFAAVAVACTLLWRRVRHLDGYRWYVGAAIFITGFFGWGTEQIAMRGNIEGLIWILVSLGAALYARRRFTGAAVAFGIAACIKPYPALWFALMARHRKFREVALGLVSGAVVTLASLMAINPNPLRAWHQISGKNAFFQDYIVAFRPMDEMAGDHSLFQSIKTIARIVRNHGLHLTPADFTVQANDPLAWKLYEVYLPLAVFIGVATLWRVWNKPVLNQIFALACITTALPFVAGGYTLSLLLVPMGFLTVFLLQDVASGAVPLTLGKMLCFLLPCAWLMGTEPMTMLHGVLKCTALLALLVASITIPLPSTLFGESPQG